MAGAAGAVVDYGGVDEGADDCEPGGFSSDGMGCVTDCAAVGGEGGGGGGGGRMGRTEE